jgi:FkbM family methyltransferase
MFAWVLIRCWALEWERAMTDSERRARRWDGEHDPAGSAKNAAAQDFGVRLRIMDLMTLPRFGKRSAPVIDSGNAKKNEVPGMRGLIHNIQRAFEASYANASQIQHNMRLNNAAVTVVPVALANEDGLRDSFLLGSTFGQFAGAQDSDLSSCETRTVSVRRLDTIPPELACPNPDLIKIDVEGAEVSVLEGGRVTLKSVRPLLMIELHGTNKAVEAELDALGYEPFVLGSSGTMTEAPVFGYVKHRASVQIYASPWRDFA